MAAQMEAAFGIDPTDILHISAKTGKGVEEVLKAVIERIPPPAGDQNAPLKAFLFDSLCVSPCFHELTQRIEYFQVRSLQRCHFLD